MLGQMAPWFEAWPEAWLLWANEHRVSQVGLQQYGPIPDWLRNAAEGLPYALGPTGPRKRVLRRRLANPLITLRRKAASLADYRVSRAGILLDAAFAARRGGKSSDD